MSATSRECLPRRRLRFALEILTTLVAAATFAACGGGGPRDAPPPGSPAQPPADTAAPAITITAPVSSGTFAATRSMVDVAGTASDAVGVTRVTWVNSLGGSGTATGTISWSIAGIALQPGSNAITVTAHDAAGNSTSATIAVTYAVNSSGALNLPRVPWEGSDYWKQFPKANAAGWSDPGFFPISVFLAKLSSAPQLKDVGVNTFMAAEHAPEDLSLATGIGMFVMAQLDEFTPAEVGDDPNVVAWFVSDECDIGLGGCSMDAEGLPPGYPVERWTPDEYGFLSVQQWYVGKVNSFDDGRFKFANYSNGIQRTFWATHTMDQLVQLVDASSADMYAYTNPDVSGEPSDYLSPDWPVVGANATVSASYGWVADQLRRFQDPNKVRPVWVFIEGARPLLSNQGARTITPDQIEGAVWAAIIHEARGIAYFQHNNDDSLNCGAALVDCEPARRDKVRAVNAKIKSLAPVINSQSYEYDFNNGTDTMLKTYVGSAYIFADIGIGDSPGSKTFALPPGITGTTATVVGENRTLPVTNGSFTDNFAAEYTHHIYKIAL